MNANIPEYSSAVISLLDSIDWTIAARTYGNSHSTLIGLIVTAWLRPGENRWVVEGGPSWGTVPKGKGGGICDALLCEGQDAVGVLEVEGTRVATTARKMGAFFGSPEPHCTKLRFGILLAYSYGVLAKKHGNGKYTSRPSLSQSEWEVINDVSRNHPHHELVVLSLEKRYETPLNVVRSRSNYYHSALSHVDATILQSGIKTYTRRLIEL